jgi:uracil DNA glycosylase
MKSLKSVANEVSTDLQIYAQVQVDIFANAVAIDTYKIKVMMFGNTPFSKVSQSMGYQ